MQVKHNKWSKFFKKQNSFHLHIQDKINTDITYRANKKTFLVS